MDYSAARIFKYKKNVIFSHTFVCNAVYTTTASQ